MMTFYREISQFKKESKKIYRILKLALVDEESLVPEIQKIKKKNIFMYTKYWSIIKETKSSAIITGSLALKCFGFIDRSIESVDLIVDPEKFDSLPLKFTKNRLDGRYSNTLNKNIGRFSIDKIPVDIYLSNKETIIEHDGFRFQNPYEILKTKMDLFMDDGSTKHFLDIRHYLTKVNKTNIFPNQ